eukprot:234544_1
MDHKDEHKHESDSDDEPIISRKQQFIILYNFASSYFGADATVCAKWMSWLDIRSSQYHGVEYNTKHRSKAWDKLCRLIPCQNIDTIGDHELHSAYNLLYSFVVQHAPFQYLKVTPICLFLISSPYFVLQISLYIQTNPLFHHHLDKRLKALHHDGICIHQIRSGDHDLQFIQSIDNVVIVSHTDSIAIWDPIHERFTDFSDYQIDFSDFPPNYLAWTNKETKFFNGNCFRFDCMETLSKLTGHPCDNITFPLACVIPNTTNDQFQFHTT